MRGACESRGNRKTRHYEINKQALAARSRKKIRCVVGLLHYKKSQHKDARIHSTGQNQRRMNVCTTYVEWLGCGSSRAVWESRAGQATIGHARQIQPGWNMDAQLEGGRRKPRARHAAKSVALTVLLAVFVLSFCFS